ncbi:MAG: hypothetical protein FRX49_08664 [Trebouxia sp. A1-2]|nr:MAG: hypothetical protein FRX49_08664 [Trebouxia sp. A1-2]
MNDEQPVDIDQVGSGDISMAARTSSGKKRAGAPAKYVWQYFMRYKDLLGKEAAHLRAQSCHSLVHHSSVEEVEVRKHGSDGVKQNFSLKDWDEGTLDDMGCYTPQSDTYQFGVMLLKSRHLSADGFRFAQKLKAKTITAVDAAEDPYLKTPNLMCEGGDRLFNQKLSHASMIESVWHNCASWQPQSRKLTRTGDEVPAVGKIVSLWSPGKPPSPKTAMSHVCASKNWLIRDRDYNALASQQV